MRVSSEFVTYATVSTVSLIRLIFTKNGITGISAEQMPNTVLDTCAVSLVSVQTLGSASIQKVANGSQIDRMDMALESAPSTRISESVGALYQHDYSLSVSVSRKIRPGGIYTFRCGSELVTFSG
jgi:hypothetical protein